MQEQWAQIYEDALQNLKSASLDADLIKCGRSVTLSIETCVEKLPRTLINVQDDSPKHISISCDGLIDLANEAILAIPYKDVPLSWRRLLTDASFLKALCNILFAFKENKVEIIKQLLKEVCSILDTAIVVAGAPGQNRRQLMDAVLDLAQNELSCHDPIVISKNDTGSRKRRRIMDVSISQNLRFPVRSLKQAPMFMEFSDMIQDDTASPFILNDIINHWPAMKEHPWSSMPYLLTVAGERHVPIEFGSQYTADDWSQRLMPFREFVETYIETTGDEKPQVAYLAQHDLFHQIPRLEQDIIVPDYCYVSPPLTRYYEIQPAEVITNAWFGPGGTVSPLHHDPYHNLLAQVVGSKYIRLYSPKQTPKLYPHAGIMSNTSQVQLQDVDEIKYPEFKHAEYVECILKAGQVLYIPPKWWHYVKSLETSFSNQYRLRIMIDDELSQYLPEYLKLLKETEWQPLETIKKGTRVNVCGVVVTSKEPRRTKGPDCACTLTIADPSRGFVTNSNGALDFAVATGVNLFHSMQVLPKGLSEGDIFILKTATVDIWNGKKKQCISVKQGGETISTWAVYKRINEQKQDVVDIPGMCLSLDDNDRKIVKLLQDWYNAILRKGNLINTPTATTTKTGILPKLAISSSKRLMNVGNIKQERIFLDIVAEVVDLFRDSKTQLLLTDYTENDHLRSRKEGMYNIKSSLIINCTCFDEHHRYLPNLSQGSFVFIRNVNSKKDKGGSMELRLSADRKAPRPKSDVNILDKNDPLLASLLERRRNYYQSVAAKNNGDRFAPPSKTEVWTVTRHKFTQMSPLSSIISSQMPVNKFKVRACVVDYKPRDIKEMARPWCSKCNTTSAPCNKTQLSCLKCLAKITEFKFQFACLLQDAHGQQLPVILYDRDAVTFLCGLKATNLYMDDNAANELTHQLEAICPSGKASNTFLEFCIKSYQVEINSQKQRRFQVFDTMLKIH
ncbi:hypothetical protein INT43_000088 [Umbelopsis isabellina]|uniref:Protection of telomeres protein 1 n=1 Tax=Mortierella isabellina TaxID=91625 RepID=A0A8H7PG86_MORIS|nr:hypothetical protein INT43_000088 [Umbelopsis isabellina]